MAPSRASGNVSTHVPVEGLSPTGAWHAYEAPGSRRVGRTARQPGRLAGQLRDPDGSAGTTPLQVTVQSVGTWCGMPPGRSTTTR
jgi:hypothetical protein